MFNSRFVRSGFTLVELLVVIAVVGVLASLVFGSLGDARNKAEMAAGAVTLRQFGTAINLYATENGDRYPGPLDPDQHMFHDPSPTNLKQQKQIVTALAEYLDISKDQQYYAEGLIPPAFPTELGKKAVVYALETQIPKPNPPPGASLDQRVWFPFGNPHDSKNSTPMLRSQLQNPADALLMTDADQEHRLISPSPNRDKAPVEPIHGEYRNALYHDGRVEVVSIYDDDRPGGPGGGGPRGGGPGGPSGGGPGPGGPGGGGPRGGGPGGPGPGGPGGGPK